MDRHQSAAWELETPAPEDSYHAWDAHRRLVLSFFHIMFLIFVMTFQGSCYYSHFFSDEEIDSVRLVPPTEKCQGEET